MYINKQKFYYFHQPSWNEIFSNKKYKKKVYIMVAVSTICQIDERGHPTPCIPSRWYTLGWPIPPPCHVGTMLYMYARMVFNDQSIMLVVNCCEIMWRYQNCISRGTWPRPIFLSKMVQKRSILSWILPRERPFIKSLFFSHFTLLKSCKCKQL